MISSLVSDFNGAPYVPMRRKNVPKLLAWSGLNSEDRFVDFGSGDGRVLISAIQSFDVKKATGYEIAGWPYHKSKFLIKRMALDHKIDLINKSAFTANLSETSFVYMYLFPKLTNRLAGKIAQEARSGTKILCGSFPINLQDHPNLRLIKQEKIDTITAYLYEKI